MNRGRVVNDLPARSLDARRDDMVNRGRCAVEVMQPHEVKSKKMQ